MKKIIVLLSMLLCLCGCGKADGSDIVKDFTDSINKSKSYKVNGTMEIMNDEESFVYNLESYYLKDKYYKVILVNQTNNHEQIILKNNEDVYVITPELNKSFKFQSEWPNNSSQAYLLDSLIKDLENDKEVKLLDSENNYVIKSGVNYPNNDELSYQKFYFDKNKNLEKVEVFDKNDIVKIKVVFENIDLKANLSKSDFDIKKYIDKEEEIKCPDNNCNNEPKKEEKKPENNDNKSTEQKPTETNNENNSQEQQQANNNQSKNPEGTNTNEQQKTSETSNFNLDSIIYPLYIPGETYLTNSETIKTDDGNRVILTFTGEKNFVIIEEKAISESVMKVVPVYGDPLMLSNSIGAITGNSLTWDANNVSYYIASTDLSPVEMMTIANSLGNTTLVAKEK